MLDRAFAKKIRKIGYEAVLHFTDEKLAASLISADTTLKEIEDHLAARNDSKNLLNRGELLIICNAKQQRLSDPDMPKITSSGDTIYYKHITINI